MGSKQLRALAEVIEREIELGTEGHVLGTWTIRYDREREAFAFDKCENEVYCEERPSVIAMDGSILDPGGPIFEG